METVGGARLRKPRRRIYFFGSLLFLAGVLLIYLTQYFASGEGAPNLDTPTKQIIEQAVARATTEDASKAFSSRSLGTAQDAPPSQSNIDNAGSSLIENGAALSAAPIEERNPPSNHEVLDEFTGEGSGTTSASVIAMAEPEPTNAEPATERMEEQTFLINFPFDSDELIPDSHHVLDSALVLLEGNPDSVASITGFTDNQGDKLYNLGLSMKRAIAVQQYLVAAGIAQERLVVEGRGVLNDPIKDDETGVTNATKQYRIVQIKVSDNRTL